MDLFTPIVPAGRWHPYFALLVNQPDESIKAVLTEWAIGFGDRDGKFVQEFQTTFNSCFWELYLNAILRGRGLCPNFGYSSPDFVIETPQAFTVEATIAQHAMGNLPEHSPLDRHMIPADLNAFNREAILRVSSALTTKYKKFRSHYASLPQVAGRPFVIAITPYDRPYFWMGCQRPIEAILYNYYVDEEKWLAAGQEESPLRGSSLYLITNNNEATVKLGYFQDDSMADVSAIIYTTSATWGKVRALSKDACPNTYFKATRFNPKSARPHVISATKSDYVESLVDGVRVYHNPFAKYPLDPSIFRDKDVCQVYARHESGGLIGEQVEGQLLSRFVFQLQRRNGRVESLSGANVQ